VRQPVVLRAGDFSFPAPELARPDGLLAIGGDLTPQRLLSAYARGIFPWFNDERGPILWWSPDPRAVITPDSVKVSRSLRKRLTRGDLRVTFDRAFMDVVAGCAAPRDSATGTWITRSMRAAYGELHRLGYAHSAETWSGDELVGGLYGVSLGRMFFGESMFARVSDASKVALVRLATRLSNWNFELIDCQIMNPHLRSLGAVDLPRREFLARLRNNPINETRVGMWQFDE
jgi:leucyl/phenylalanyl-tRNA---protein transferase